jgi:ribosomal protein L37AE/L43A
MKAYDLAGVAKIPNRRFPLPSCPVCNDLLLAPTASAHVSERKVRHVWACESCGHGFVTSVRLPIARQPELARLS